MATFDSEKKPLNEIDNRFLKKYGLENFEDLEIFHESIQAEIIYLASEKNRLAETERGKKLKSLCQLNEALLALEKYAHLTTTPEKHKIILNRCLESAKAPADNFGLRLYHIQKSLAQTDIKNLSLQNEGVGPLIKEIFIALALLGVFYLIAKAVDVLIFDQAMNECVFFKAPMRENLNLIQKNSHQLLAYKEDFASCKASFKEALAQRSFELVQENCITDFILKNAPQVIVDKTKRADSTPPLATHSTTSISKTNKKVDKMLTTVALEVGGQKNECWQQRAEVNDFFHNALAHFIFIYLDVDPSFDIKTKIQMLQLKLNNDAEREQVIQSLKDHKENLVCTMKKSVAQLIVPNPANPNNLGGAVTYKRGTVEEALCRRGDLFLDMLFFHANGEYQKNIFSALLRVFSPMLETGSLPIQSKADSDLIATTWLNLIYKTTHQDYHLKPAELHIHETIFFIDKSDLPSLDNLSKTELFTSLKEQFLTACKYATVLDIACTDQRLQTKALTFFGLQEKEPSSDFHTELQLIANTCGTLLKNQAGPHTLALVPLGCGAFGNKIEDFWTAVIHNLSLLTQHTSVSLVIRPDNGLTVTELYKTTASPPI